MNVQELLESKEISYSPKGKDYLVSCLNSEHEDRNPSMRVDQITGIFNCFSCGYKGNLFTLFGEKANHLQIKRELLKKKINNKRAETVGLSFPANHMPYLGNWREISPETYRKFEAFQHVSENYTGRIVFPIRDISGKIVAFNGRHTSAGIPKYKIVPTGAKIPFYPQANPIKGKIILVEGIYDVLNLYDKGLKNSVCASGTKNVSVEKLELLKIRGVEGIDIFFDGDEAGQNGAKTIKELCEKVGLTTRNIYMKDLDPGSLTEVQVKKVEKRLYA